jgi:hypothetical protein
MHPDQDLEQSLSPIEIEFFAHAEGDEIDQPSPTPRAHLSRYLKWVVVIVAAAITLLAIAAHERHQPDVVARGSATMAGDG